MRPLGTEDMLDLERYEALRPAYRDAVIAHKRRRRLAVGEKVTLVFENRETLRFQVQEMLRVEGIRERDKIQAELDVYNELMPGERELSATLFVEITQLAQIRPELDRLIGIDEHVCFVLGAGSDEEVIRARFDPKQMEEDRISAVQYVRFAFDEAQLRRLSDASSPARIRIDHPNYRHEAELPDAVRDSLLADLAREPEPLLGSAELEPGPDAVDQTLFETGRVRAIRPARPAAPGHVIVEPAASDAGLLEADPELLSALMAAVQRAAREVLREQGACRVVTDLHGPGERLRWHLFAPR